MADDYDDATPEQVKEAFQYLVEKMKVTAKHLVERKALIEAADPYSIDAKVHREVLEKELAPEVDRLTSQVYSAILTYNKFPEMFKHIDRSDMLKADTALQEVTN